MQGDFPNLAAVTRVVAVESDRIAAFVAHRLPERDRYGRGDHPRPRENRGMNRKQGGEHRHRGHPSPTPTFGWVFGGGGKPWEKERGRNAPDDPDRVDVGPVVCRPTRAFRVHDAYWDLLDRD